MAEYGSRTVSRGTLVITEITPALDACGAGILADGARENLPNRQIDHRLAQIALDGAQKLGERVFPLMIANANAERTGARPARIVRGWLALTQADLDTASRIRSCSVGDSNEFCSAGRHLRAAHMTRIVCIGECMVSCVRSARIPLRDRMPEMSTTQRLF